MAPNTSTSEERRMRYLIALPVLILMKIEEALVLRIAKRRMSR